MKRTKFLRVFFLFDSRNEMSNSSYILNINYNINKENFAEVHSTSYILFKKAQRRIYLFV